MCGTFWSEFFSKIYTLDSLQLLFDKKLMFSFEIKSKANVRYKYNFCNKNCMFGFGIIYWYS